ncbi:MAG: SDR family NAD(P)-dependent oxidoreductase, partial [Polyangiales bacterium]
MDQVFAGGLFDGEVVLVTGGGTGIGFAAATEMGRLGAKVAICGRRAGPLQDAVDLLAKEGIEALGLPCDIREPDVVDGFIDAVVARFGRIDVLVNNAGGQV